MRIRTSLLAVLALAGVFAGGPIAASAAVTPTVTAQPGSVAIGEATTVTAVGLGGLESAEFGLGDTGSGGFTGDGVDADATTATVQVSAGTASVGFTPTRSGDVVIAVGTGETVLGQVTLSVSAASAEPAASSAPSASTDVSSSIAAGDDSAQAEPDPEAETGRFAFVLIPLLAAAVVAVGAIFVIARGRRRRRGD